MMWKRFAIGLAGGLATVVLGAGTAQATGHGTTSAAELGPLYWQNDLAIWTAVVFVILLLVLWKFAWGPIADGLARRERGIASQISEAEAANRDARQLLADYRKKLDVAGDEVRKMLAEGRHDAELSAQRIVQAAHDEAKAEHQKALAEIDQAATGAMAELAARSAELAVNLAGKIVKSELRAADHAELVKQAVADFTKQ